MESTKNMTVYSDEQAGMIAELSNNKVSMFSSLKAETHEEKAQLFNAMNAPEKRVGDMVGKVIKIKDVFAEMIELTNPETGEVSTAPRIVIVDDKNVTYQAVSIGIFSAIKKMFGLFGLPTYEPAIPVEIRQINKGQNRILTFDIK